MATLLVANAAEDRVRLFQTGPAPLQITEIGHVDVTQPLRLTVAPNEQAAYVLSGNDCTAVGAISLAPPASAGGSCQLAADYTTTEIAVSADGLTAYVIAEQSEEMVVLNVDPAAVDSADGGLSQASSITVPAGCYRLALTPDGRWALVTECSGTGGVNSVELDTGAVGSPYLLTAAGTTFHLAPTAIEVVEYGSLLRAIVCANSSSPRFPSEVVVLEVNDPPHPNLEAAVPAPGELAAIAVTPLGDWAFAAGGGPTGGYVLPIKGLTPGEQPKGLDPIPVGPGGSTPRQIVISADGNSAYMTSRVGSSRDPGETGTLTVIDISDRNTNDQDWQKVELSLSGNLPEGLAITPGAPTVQGCLLPAAVLRRLQRWYQQWSR